MRSMYGKNYLFLHSLCYAEFWILTVTLVKFNDFSHYATVFCLDDKLGGDIIYRLYIVNHLTCPEICLLWCFVKSVHTRMPGPGRLKSILKVREEREMMSGAGCGQCSSFTSCSSLSPRSGPQLLLAYGFYSQVNSGLHTETSLLYKQ